MHYQNTLQILQFLQIAPQQKRFFHSNSHLALSKNSGNNGNSGKTPHNIHENEARRKPHPFPSCA
jgi:hypothetical protein